jgi:hypothetical protein
MTNGDRHAQNIRMLGQCGLPFAQSVVAVIAGMEKRGWCPRIQCAWRDPASQMTAFKTHHSELEWGFHNATDGQGRPESLAVDMLDDDHPLSPSVEYCLDLARIARLQGLETGILWDLAPTDRDILDALIRNGGDVPTGVNMKVGFDPTHVEITGVTLQQARAGERPLPLVPLASQENV